jgi:hypothetical protein
MSIAARPRVSWLAWAKAPAGPVSSRAAGVLRQLETDSVRHFGYPVTIEPLYEAMGTYSRVLRVRLHLTSGPVDAYVKLYEPCQGSLEERARFRRYVVNEFERTRLARRCATASATVPAPLVCLPDELLVMTQEAVGIPLQQRLKQVAILRTAANIEALTTDLRRVGEWLRAFQAGVPPFGREMRDLREYLDVRLRRLVALASPAFTEETRRAFLEAFDDSASCLSAEDRRRVPIHADLCPSNILVRDDAITVLDFASSTDGARCWDLAHLTMHLRFAGRRFRFGGRMTQRLLRALIDGFDPSLEEDTPAFRFAMIPHAACYLMDGIVKGRYGTRMFGEARLRRDVAHLTAVAGVRLRHAR